MAKIVNMPGEEVVKSIMRKPDKTVETDRMRAEIAAYRKALRESIERLQEVEVYDPTWATEKHIQAIRRVLRTRGFIS